MGRLQGLYSQAWMGSSDTQFSLLLTAYQPSFAFWLGREEGEEKRSGRKGQMDGFIPCGREGTEAWDKYRPTLDHPFFPFQI